MIGCILHVRTGVAHRYTRTGPLQHLDVVAAVAERNDVGCGNTEMVNEYLQRYCLVVASRRHIDDGQATKLHLAAIIDQTGHHGRKFIKPMVIVVVKRD